MAGPLADLRILDLTRILAGPFCTMILSDLGADIIKVERPEGGDLSRGTGPFIEGESYYFISVNRGKKSITLNLADPEGVAILTGLAAASDVLVENFLPGTMARLGIDYETLRQVNPRLIYCSISGFGQTGPYAQRSALDIVVQAMGGIMSITGEPGGVPVRPGASLGDIVAGLFAAIAIQSAVHERERSGLGQMIDIGMLDCQFAILEAALGRYLATGEVQSPLGSRHPTFTPFQAFRTTDGWVVVAIVGGLNDQWPLFCSALDRIDLIDDPRFRDGHLRTQHYEELIPALNEAMAKRSTDQWLVTFMELGIPSGPVNSIDQAVADPQVQHRGLITEVPHDVLGSVKVVNSPIVLSRTPARPQGKPPALGEHNRAVLTELLGYSEERIAELERQGAL